MGTELTIGTKLEKNLTEMEETNELNRIYNVNDNFLDVIDSPNKAYLVGLWYADGTVYDKTNHIKN